jgi:hypothetical protein
MSLSIRDLFNRFTFRPEKKAPAQPASRTSETPSPIFAVSDLHLSEQTYPSSETTAAKNDTSPPNAVNPQGSSDRTIIHKPV